MPHDLTDFGMPLEPAISKGPKLQSTQSYTIGIVPQSMVQATSKDRDTTTSHLGILP